MSNLKISRGGGRYSAQHSEANGILSKQGFFILFVAIAILVSIFAITSIGYANVQQNTNPISVNVSQSKSTTLYAPDAKVSANSYQWQIYVPQVDDFVDILDAKSDSLEVDASLLKNALDNNNNAQIKAQVLNSEGDEVRSQVYLISYTDDVDESSLPSSSNLNNVNSLLSEGGTTIKLEEGNVETDSELVANETKKVTVNFVDMNGVQIALPNINEFEVVGSVSRPFVWAIQLKDYLGIPQSDIVVDPTGALETSLSGEDNVLTLKSTTGISTDVNVTIKFMPGTANYYIDCYYETPQGTYPLGAPSKTVSNTGPVDSEIPVLADFTTCHPEINYPDSWEITAYDPAQITQDGSAHCTIAYGRLFSLIVFNTNGGVNGPKAIFARYGSNYIEQPREPKMAGYNFKGWYDNPEFSGSPITQFTTIPHVKPEGIIYYAKFELDPAPDRIVNIVYWGENANADTQNFDKSEYSYISEQLTIAPVNSTFNLTNDLVTPPAGPTHTTAEWLKLYKCSDVSQVALVDKDIEVKPDNTAICNVYLYRTTFTWHFYRDRSWPFSDTDYGKIIAKWDEDIYDSSNPETARHYHGEKGFKQICQQAYGEDSGPWEIQSGGPYTNMLTNMSTENHDSDIAGAEFGNYEYASWTFENNVDFRYYTQDVDADYSKHKSIETSGAQEGFTLFKTSRLTNYVNDISTLFFPSYYYFTDDEYIPILGFSAPKPDGLNGPKTDGSTRTGGVDGGYSVYYIRNTHNVYLNRLVSDDHPDEYYETLSNVHYEKKLGDIPVPDSVPGYFTDESDKTLKNFVPYNPGSQYIDSNLVFAGWTFDQNGLGDVVDLNSQYLPDNSVNLYAKWEAPKVDVKFVWPQSAQNPEIEEPSGTVLLEDQVYGTYLDPDQIPAVRDFAGSGYEFIARYYYDTPEDKAAGIKTYFHPKEMTVPAHDIDIYTEYTRADIARYTVQYKLKKTSSEEDDVFVAADRTGVGYIGDTVTVYPKQTDELYFDYRSFYIPLKTSDSLVMAQDPTENIIVFEYELSPSASLDYTVYYLNNRLIDPSQPDVIPDEAIIEKQEVKDHKYNFVTLEAKEFAGFELSDDCADTQTTLLGADASKNIIKFYYNEKTVTLNYSIKLNGTVTDPLEGNYYLDVYSQEVYAATNVVKSTSVAPASTATCVSPYEFVGWTDADDKTLTTTNTLNPTIAEGEVWEENATFYANFTNASSLTVTMKVAEGQDTWGSLTNYDAPFTVSANSGYTMNGTAITFHGTATEEKTVVATPAPEGSYAFAYWTVEGDETHYFISNGTITANVTVVAHFVNNAITVTFTDDDHCTLSSTGSYKVPSGTYYVANDNGTFEIPGYVSAITATPAETYTFTSWSISPAVVEEGTFDQTCTVKPVAEIIKYHLTFVSSTSNRGKVDTDSYDAPANSTYTINANKTLTITPSDGSSAITVGFKEVSPGFECKSWVVNPPFETEGTISHDAKFAASFDYITFDISFIANPADKGNVSKSSLNVPYGTRYRLDNNNDLIFEYPYEKTPDNVTKSAIADSHYHFVNWTVDGDEISSGELTEAASFVANFAIDKFNVKLKPNNSSMGKVDNTDLVSIDVDYGSVYKKASSENGLLVVETEHSPNANEHHSFIKWLDDNGSDLTEGDHQVTKDIVLTAVFDIDKYKLTFEKGSVSGGHMERNGSQIESHTIDNVPYGTQYYQDTFGTIHVDLASGEDSVGEVADEGYLVDGWTQKIGEAEASDVDYKEKYTVTDNTEFKSYFKLMELRVICTIQGEYKDEGGSLDYTEAFKEKYGTPYVITDDGHTGLDCKSSSITFTDPETNDQFVVTATANDGYFWDGWYVTYTDKEEPNGTIVKEKAFSAVFWKVNDSKYIVNHHMQNVDDDGNLVTDQSLWPVVSEEVPCTTGAKRTPEYCPHDGYTALTPRTEKTIVDWDMEGYVTTWDYYYQLKEDKYNLTINYHVPDGYEAPASVEKSLYYTARYSVPSPNIDGLVVDTSIVEGSMPLNNLIVDVNYAVPPSPDNPENYNAQTGDSNFWMIIGLIAIVIVAGGVTYVVARKRKSYKPKHK